MGGCLRNRQHDLPETAACALFSAFKKKPGNLPIRAALHREQCDSELIETRKENEVLSLFWSKYNAFNGAIRNQTEEEEQFKSEYWKDFHPKNLLIALRYAS